MWNVAVALTAILVTWSIMAPVLGCVGLGIRRLAGGGAATLDDVVGSYWVGFAFTLGLAQIWNLLWPATGWMWLAIAPLAGAGALSLCTQMNWTSARRILSSPVAAATLLVAFALAIRIALLAAGPVEIFDTGSYHLPASKWAHALPTVPGLANLHSRLGFNSSFFPFAASIAEGPWTDRSHHVAMGLPILMTLMTSIAAVLRIAGKSFASLPDLFAASLVAPAIYFSHWGNYPASLGTNCTTGLLALAGAHFALVALADIDITSSSARYHALGAALILCAATTVKMTSAPFTAMALLVVARHSFARAPKMGRGARLRTIWWMVGAVLLLASPWLTRSIVLSGYPLYPLSICPAPVDWRVPSEQARIEANWTRDFSRGSWDQPAQGVRWIGRWFRLAVWRHAGAVTIPVMITIGASLLLLRRKSRRDPPTGSPEWRGGIQIAGCAVGAAMLWFVTAPDPRFAAGLLWLLAGLSSALAARSLLAWAPRLVMAVPAIVATLVLTEVSRLPFDLSRHIRATQSNTTADGDWTMLDRGLVPLPTPALEDFITSSGLVISVPSRGTRVWSGPLLVTPHPSPNLQRRDSHSLGRGFKSNGPWQPRGYPSPNFAYHLYVEQLLTNQSDPG